MILYHVVISRKSVTFTPIVKIVNPRDLFGGGASNLVDCVVCKVIFSIIKSIIFINLRTKTSEISTVSFFLADCKQLSYLTLKETVSDISKKCGIHATPKNCRNSKFVAKRCVASCGFCKGSKCTFINRYLISLILKMF